MTNQTSTAPTVSTATIAHKLILGAESLKTAIASIQVAGKKLDNDIQMACMSIANHIELHGDVTLADKLFHAMPKGSRRNAMADWMVLHGKVMLNLADNKDTVIFLFDKKATTKLDDGAAMPWWECKPEKPVTFSLDMDKLIEQAIKRKVKAESEGLEIVMSAKTRRMLEVYDGFSIVPAGATPVNEMTEVALHAEQVALLDHLTGDTSDSTPAVIRQAMQIEFGTGTVYQRVAALRELASPTPAANAEVATETTDEAAANTEQAATPEQVLEQTEQAAEVAA